MKYELAMHHARLSRRDALKLGVAGAAAATVGTMFMPGVAGAEEAEPEEGGRRRGERSGSGPYTDEMFDVAAAAAGGWAPSPYGPDDQRGTFNELTPERTGDALKLLRRAREVKTYQLGEVMFNGFPAYPSEPPRLHDMFLLGSGVDFGPEFAAAGGIQGGTEPAGPNRLVGFEERFAANFTFQIGTQIDGLNHIGVDGTFYNGFQAVDIATPTGTSKLGNENMGPVCTRAVVLDIVGLKVAARATDAYFTAPNGQLVLNGNYRITIDDIEKAMKRQRIKDPIGAGDVPIIHTGWNHLVRDDPDAYLLQEPGIFLAEARYFADRKPALVAADTWGLEVLDPALTNGNAFPVHQELITHNGIRIGESFVTDAAIADHCYEGVLVATPENVPGATCGSSPPVLLGQPGRAPRD
ncbi:MAG: cyclase family protein [Acidimicrobiales bacterium]